MIPLNLLGLSTMGSLLIIFVKLCSYKDSDVGNLGKFEYFSSTLHIRVTREIQFNKLIIIIYTSNESKIH